MDQYKVEAKKCGAQTGKCSDAKKISGRWSPIYSQAMMVELDNGMRFITNFRYNLKDGISINDKD